MKTLSEFYTEDLAGKTVESVKHAYYRSMEIAFTDGTAYTMTPSGTPPTIFVNQVRPVGPVARVWRVEA